MSVEVHEIAAQFRALYGYDNGGDAPGWLAIFTLPDRQTRFFAGDDLGGDTPHKIAALAEAQHVYHSWALQREPVNGRGTAENAYALPSAHLDLDVKGPHHAGDALPVTDEEALEFVATLPLEPTLITHSGGGFQVHWCFHELQVLETERDRQLAALLVTRVQEGIQQQASARGWKLDSTSDLARVLRVAGTLNHKSDPPRPARIVHLSGARYEPRQLLGLCSPKQRVTPPAPHYRGNMTTAPKERRIQALIDRVGPRGEGDRDNTAYDVACWLVRDFALSDADAMRWLVAWNAGNAPPLPERALAEKLQSAHKYGKRAIGSAA